MPPSDTDHQLLSEWQASDDLVIRLVEEIAGAARGDGARPLDDADLAIVEQRLRALRAASELTVPWVSAAPTVETSAPPAGYEGTATVKQRREPAASADAVILDALAAAGVRPDFVPDRERRKLRPAGSAPRHRPRPAFYLTALFLVMFSLGFFVLDRSWSDSVTAGLAGYWTEPTRVRDSAQGRASQSSRNDEGAVPLPGPLTATGSAAVEIGTEPAAGPAGWVRRKVKVYKVSADGTIDFGAPAPQDDPGSQ